MHLSPNATDKEIAYRRLYRNKKILIGALKTGSVEFLLFVPEANSSIVSVSFVCGDGGSRFTKFICLSLKICRREVLCKRTKGPESHLYLAGKLPAYIY